jgi:signal transduction histidine kinase
MAIRGSKITAIKKGLTEILLAVPVRIKIAGIVVLPVLILGLSLSAWIRGGLSDWLYRLLGGERIQATLHAGSWSVIVITILAVLLSIALTYALMIVLTRPLLELRRVANRVAEGELGTRAHIWAEDEIGDVAGAVNTMIDHMVQSQTVLQRTNERLDALLQVSSAVGKGLDQAEVLNAALFTTLKVTGLRCGWLFLRDTNADAYRLAAAVAPPADMDASFICRCQRAMLDGQLGPSVSMRTCDRGWWTPTKKRTPVHLSVPLEAKSESLGIMNLLWTKEEHPSPGDLELLDAIGIQVSEAVSNASLHADLRGKEAARQVLLRALVSAQEDERSRVSRELHDGAGQALTSLLVRMKALEAVCDDEQLQKGLAMLCTSASEAIEQIRDISYGLRPPALEELGLETALRSLIADLIGDTNLATSFVSDLNNRRLPDDIETATYRIAQEALTNVVRHASANTVRVSIDSGDSKLVLKIEDDGIGFSPHEAVQSGRIHLGIPGIQERVEQLGGTLAITSAPGAGACMEVTLPVYEEVTA